MNKISALACCFVSIIVSSHVFAQGRENERRIDAEPAGTTQSAGEQTSIPKNRLQDATINLRTTITGNQEQPRVMYILPWQSPASPEWEMDGLSSQQDAVFGHVERDELQRTLEATGELDDDTTH